MKGDKKVVARRNNHGDTFDRDAVLYQLKLGLILELRAISAFPTVFSKGLFPRDVKRCHCVGMG